ncbi:hypothetical protein FM113_00165 [Leucobacter sp. 7(1)]|uniref:hypothetical protein n=1 Tax=Leucobacter sp. 7(1) TaxID=1255613 RepID=UPI00097F40AE|nr:hypothetical protein [Leucobacter sp. 7(1)]SJN07957.1 hypothetical protein FM113_00165 [Leucobacter sp. 7(1)]
MIRHRIPGRRTRWARAAALAATITTALLCTGPAAHALSHYAEGVWEPSNAVRDPAPTLIVSPASSLFSATLHPGEEVIAPATLHNRSSRELAVGLTPVLVSGEGHDRAAAALTIATLRNSACTPTTMASVAGVPLRGAPNLAQGTLEAGESTSVCIKVSYPVEHALSDAAVAVVDLAFSAVERELPEPRGGLVSTGQTAHLSVIAGVGAAVLLVGGSCALHRGRRHFGRRG